MEANTTVIRHWEDLVFENRNKLYGAYCLRRAYSNRLLAGLAATIVFLTIILSLQNNRPPEEKKVAIPLADDNGIELKPRPLIEPRRPHRPEQRQVVRDERRIVVTTEEVELVEQEEVEAIDEFITGDDLGSGEVSLSDGSGTLPFAEPEPVEEPAFRDFAEVMPHYEGGFEAMMKFIQKRIRYPRVPRQVGIEGTVFVRFLVNGDGSVSDIEIIKGVHPDCDAEAVRVISMLPAWKGGSHNGRPVSVRMVLPIKFNLQK